MTMKYKRISTEKYEKGMKRNTTHWCALPTGGILLKLTFI
jgi:hypothetical protein